MDVFFSSLARLGDTYVSHSSLGLAWARLDSLGNIVQKININTSGDMDAFSSSLAHLDETFVYHSSLGLTWARLDSLGNIMPIVYYKPIWGH